MSDQKPKLDSLFEAAVEIDSLAERATFLDASCGDDTELREQIDQLLASYGQAEGFLEQPAADLDATFLTDASGKDLAASLEAGLAPVFGDDAAVVIGDAKHSVLRALGNTLDEVPHVSLRESNAEGADPISRPKSPEMPKSNADSRYRLDGEIARGGMGAIIKGRDTDLGRDLAIKVLLDEHKAKPEVIQRFVEEAQIGGQLQHPGIAPVYELGQFSDQRPFFSMKLVKGRTLAELLAARHEPSKDRAMLLGVFEQICQTMAYAHSRGVIHRDLKPANIMVGAFGEVQVMDWGLAKVLSIGGVADEKKAHTKHNDVSIIQTLRNVGSDSPGSFGSCGSNTQMGSVMGTPAYMPPEQALGEVDRLDERSDVFGLGAILCEILTGKPPYVGKDGTHVFRQASRGKLEDCFARLDACGVEPELIDLTKHMLALEPEDRLRNAGAVTEGITRYLAGVQDRLKQAELAEAEANARAEDLTRRRKLHIALAGLLLLIAVGAGISAMGFRQQREVQARLAHKNITLAKENDEKRKDAELAQKRIATEKKNVEAQKDLAVANEAAAIALQKTLRRELYIADMQQVRQSYLEGASNRVDGLLKKYVPLESETDLRGWEWYYWWRVSQLHVREFGDLPPLKSFAIAPDRTWIAVQRWPDQMIMLDAQTMETVSEFAVGGVNQEGAELAIAPDGEVLACISNTSVRLWRTEDWSELPSLEHDRVQGAIVFSPAGLLAAADPQGRVTFWDVQQNLKQGEPLETNQPLNCLAFSPRGNRLATSHTAAGNGDTGSLVVWDVATRKRQTQLIGKSHPVSALAWNTRGDSSLIAAGFADGNIRMWEGTSYGERDWLVAGAPVRTLAFSLDGEKLVAGTARNNAVVVWETDSGRRISQIKGHFRVVRGVGFAGDGQTAYSCSEDGNLKTWTIANSQSFTRLRGDVPITDVLLRGRVTITDQKPEDHTALSDNRQFLAVYKPCGEEENRLQVWRTDGDEPDLLSDHVLPGDPLAKPPHNMVISDDGGVAAWSKDRILFLVDLSNGKQTSGSFDSRANKLALSHDGKLIADHNNWDAHIWNLASGTPENRVNLSGFPAHDIQFSPDGKFLAQALLNNDLQLHDAVTGELLHRFQGHAGSVLAIDFSPDGALLASGGGDGTVRLWDVTHRSLLVTFPSHDQPVWRVAFSPDGQTILSTSADGETRLWKGGTESDMEDVRYWGGQAKLHEERGSWEAALADWTEAIRLAPDDTSFYLARAEVRIRLEQFSEAVADYQLAFQHATPADGSKLLAIGSTLGSKLTFDPNEAFIPVLSRALEADRRNVSLLQQRADLHAVCDQWGESAADNIAILQIRRSNANWTTGPDWSSSDSRLLQDLAGDKALFDALRTKLPDDPQLWLARGRGLAVRSEWKAAAKAYAQYQEAIPVDSEVWFEIACSQRIVGDESGSRKLLTHLHELAGENPSPFAAYILARTTGLAAQDPELAQLAVDWGQQAVSDTNNAWYVHALGLAQYRAGDHAAAIKNLLTSLEAGWGEAQNQVVLALAYEANNDRTEAQRWLAAARKSQAKRQDQAVNGVVSDLAIDWLAMHALLREAKMQIEENGGNN